MHVLVNSGGGPVLVGIMRNFRLGNVGKMACKVNDGRVAAVSNSAVRGGFPTFILASDIRVRNGIRLSLDP